MAHGHKPRGYRADGWLLEYRVINRASGLETQLERAIIRGWWSDVRQIGERRVRELRGSHRWQKAAYIAEITVRA
jgi:hypothetical protein